MKAVHPLVSDIARERGIIPFQPAWWLPGGHAQTVAGRFLRRNDRQPLIRERLELPDGDFLDLDADPAPGLPDDAPVVIVLHGLEGCSLSNYMATVGRELTEAGVRSIRLNFRGCGGEMNRLARFYHAGDTADLDHVVRLLRQRYPQSVLGAIGFSLGGNVLLKYLGELGGRGPELLGGAVAVSVPFDLAAGTRRLEMGVMSAIYTRYFVRKLRAKTSRKRELLTGLCEVDRGARARTIREFDEAVTSRLHGFRDAWHYYEESSSAGWLHAIRVPTLIIHSLDDPFLPPEAVPTAAIEDNPWLTAVTTRRGGHVGFVEGPLWKPGFWAEREAARFLDRTLRKASGSRSIENFEF